MIKNYAKLAYYIWLKLVLFCFLLLTEIQLCFCFMHTQHTVSYTLYIYSIPFILVLFVFILTVFFILNFGIFRSSFVSIDCRFITLFAIASCHDWMTLFRSRYSSVFFFFFFLLLNNIECMMWSVIFEIDKSLRCREWGELGKQKNSRRKTEKKQGKK